MSYPETVQNLGHNVPLVFMGVFGVGTALAGLAGVMAGPVLGTFPGMAVVLGSIVFVTIVVGGLGSLWGALGCLFADWMAANLCSLLQPDHEGCAHQHRACPNLPTSPPAH